MAERNINKENIVEFLTNENCISIDLYISPSGELRAQIGFANGTYKYLSLGTPS